MFNVHTYQWRDHISVLIMTLDGKSCCKIQIYDNEPTLAYISGLFVDPNQRHKGIGSEIIKYCEEYAKNRGCQKVSLISDIDNWTREWYKKIGYDEVSSQVLFEKKLIKNEKDS